MEQLIQFTKIEAAGNDFIIFDAPEASGLLADTEIIKKLCRRRLSIGADGVILMDDLRMRYFNADGSAGAMCGNGLRAAALFSYIQGRIPRLQEVTMVADDGPHQVFIENPDKLKVQILEGTAEPQNPQLAADLPPGMQTLGFFNTGVPHLVLRVDDNLDQLDVKKTGKKLRYHSTFAPHGTNVNFTFLSDEKTIHMRTYERGVENETLACGTGAVAAFLAYHNLAETQANALQVCVPGGRLFVERYDGKLYLTGSAHIVYVGHISI